MQIGDELTLISKEALLRELSEGARAFFHRMEEIQPGSGLDALAKLELLRQPS